ncbi:ABC-type transport system involved in multi-copper enzyme maturation permease subunit [Clostridium algifaecis]|uniref:ABC-type transport system involved in multi-copper enzyme maturation permease subunit n=1 Tax=Clostridium algifaecis TaxID=1472040 RepID=A0ABS4KS80_9CLOT|nr:ABC transporter permease [Clostridium algifaecis]MBP2032890.1 ABC-type transport system involved in multi-copper enzyme maturation permease subunit [Clostridium algifaecis]
MIKLIKIELEKCNLKKYIKNAIIANIIILGGLIFITYPIKYLKIDVITDYSIIFTMIDSLVRATFMIFSSVLISNIIIKELKNRKMITLFSDPIDRKKSITSKIIIVIMFTFLTIVLSNIFLGISFYFLNKVYNLVPTKLNLNIITISTLTILMYAITSSLMNLIPMYFGIIMKSTFVTILSSIVLVSIVCSDNNGFSLNSIIAIPLSLAALGILSAYLSIKHIENLDIKK